MEKEKLLVRLDELIGVGQELFKLAYNKPVFMKLYQKWTINYQNLLILVYDKQRLEQIFENLHKGFKNKIEIALSATSILEATKDDLEGGYIGKLEHKIRKVEVDNLLDYSFQLLDEKDDALDRCACVLARVVLEKSLQLLCDKYDCDSSQKADIMNQQLRDKGVY